MKRFFVKIERSEQIGKICPRGELCAVELPHRERVEHGLVAHVVPCPDVREREAKWQAPREQRFAGCDHFHREPMSFEHRVREHARRAVQRDRGARFETARGDGDVVARRGQPPDGVEGNWTGHVRLSDHFLARAGQTIGSTGPSRKA